MDTRIYISSRAVESVTSILKDSPKGDSSVSGKSTERQDSSSSDLRTRMASDKHTKHSRKPQYVFSSKKLVKELRGDRGAGVDGAGEGEEKVSESVSFSVSLGWDVPSGGGVVPRAFSSTRSRTGTPASNREMSVRGGDDAGSRASPTGSGDSDDEDDGRADDSDSSRGTVVSLSTSLPIVFSGLQQTPKPSPLAATGSGGSGDGVNGATGDGDGAGGEGGGGGGGGGAKDFPSPTPSIPKVSSILAERVGGMVRKGAHTTPVKGTCVHVVIGMLLSDPVFLQTLWLRWMTPCHW